MRNKSLLLLVILLVLPTVTSAETLVWVANKSSDSISIIDADDDEEVLFNVKRMCCVPNTICNPQNPNTPCINGPHDIAFSAGMAFVTAYDGDRVGVFDTTPLPASPPTYLGSISVGDRPQGIAVVGDFAFVANSSSDSVTVLDISSFFPSFYDEIAVGDDPNCVTASPDGSEIWVTNNGDDSVTVIDAVAPEEIDTIDLGQDVHAPRRIVLGDIPDVGLRAYTVNANSDDVSVINASNYSVVETVDLDADDKPRGLALRPNLTTHKLYVTEYDGLEISIIDTETNEVTATQVPHTGANPYRIAITPDGMKGYIANPEVGEVSVLNPDSDQMFGYTIEVQNTPGGIAVSELE